MSDFKKTYQTLLETLDKIYGKDYLVLGKEVQVVRSDEDWHALSLRWWQDTQDLESAIVIHDEKVFGAPPECWTNLCIPDIWSKALFSENSKGYIWDYLQKLTGFAKAIHHITPPKSTTSPGVVSTIPDISPPFGDMPDGIKKLLGSIPPSLMEKVKTIADDLGTKVQNGEQKIEDLKYDKLGQELFSNMNKQEMNEMVEGISGVMQNLDLGALLQGLNKQ